MELFFLLRVIFGMFSMKNKIWVWPVILPMSLLTQVIGAFHPQIKPLLAICSQPFRSLAIYKKAYLPCSCVSHTSADPTESTIFSSVLCRWQFCMWKRPHAVYATTAPAIWKVLAPNSTCAYNLLTDGSIAFWSTLLFQGRVRDHSNDGSINYAFYEYYRGMVSMIMLLLLVATVKVRKP